MSAADLILGLFVSLGITVAVLGVSLWLAHTHRVKAHVATVGAFVVCLLVTLYFAESLGGEFEFTAPAKPIHLTLAGITTVFLLAPIATGWLHWYGKVGRSVHVRLVWAFLALVVLTLGTGLWMFSTRTPRPTPAAPG
jgi:hypothetical protein